MGLPPWEASSSQLFALVTGANSGLGYAICQRLIDEFLTTTGPTSTSHLIILLTTRSPEKSKPTISKLRKHLRHFAEHSSTAVSWIATSRKEREEDGGWSAPYHWKNTVSRVHFFALVLDLCDLRGVRDAARTLVDGEVVLGEGVDGKGEGYRIPRLDVVVMNAGIGGWKGLNWWRAVWKVLTDLVYATTYPDYKVADVGRRVRLQSAFRNGGKQELVDADGETVDGEDGKGKGEEEPVLGEVFTANVFGHYMLGHWLMPLLSRPARPLSSSTEQTDSTTPEPSSLTSSTSNIDTPTSSHSSFETSALNPNPNEENDDSSNGQGETSRAQSPGRIIWLSSIEAIASTFSVDDIQGLESLVPYESSKRLTDILALTSTLPGVEKYSQSYFQYQTPKASNIEEIEPPEIYVTHPGICGTEIIPLPWILVQAMNIAFYMARWLGSVWHAILPYTGACAIVWVALMPDHVLKSAAGGSAKQCKWGSSTDRAGNARVKKTEVEGWGWTGDVEELKGENAVKEVRRGRRRGVKDLKAEERVEFERAGGEAWREMERLRGVWEEVLSREE